MMMDVSFKCNTVSNSNRKGPSSKKHTLVSRRRHRLNKIPISENIFAACKQVRPCSVILQRLTDKQLRKYCSESAYEEYILAAKQKNIGRKSHDSDDEDFFGFDEPPYRNNENLKSVMENNLFEKSPLKAISRIEAIKNISWPSSISNDLKTHNTQSLRGSHGKKFEEGRFMKHRRKSESDIAIESDLHTVNLETLKLYKYREKQDDKLARLIQDKGKEIKSRKGVVEKSFMSGSMDYYSDEYYILKCCRKIPIWCDENINKAIMNYQDQIPVDIINDYFQAQPQPPLTLASIFFSNPHVMVASPSHIKQLALSDKW